MHIDGKNAFSLQSICLRERQCTIETVPGEKSTTMIYDLLIKNGFVFDGLGGEGRNLDIAIHQGRVALMQAELNVEAQEVIDARGLWITPGFIDIHTHYDLEIEIAPALLESVRHGITSIVMGNCSLSVAVGKPHDLADIFQRVETLPKQLVEKWLKGSVNWKSPREYLEHLRSLPLGPNVSPLFGHSALRSHVMGLERSLNSHASPEEIEQMRKIAQAALQDGFSGISVDMVPWHMMSGSFRGRTIPSQHASFKEYAMLANVCREHDAVFQVTPNPQNLFSLLHIFWMALGVLRRPLRMTILTALDSVHDRNLWKAFPRLLFVMNTLLRSNIRFQTLPEPFTIFSDGPITPLFEEFPAGVELNNLESAEERKLLWARSDFRAQFRKQWTQGWRKTFHRRLDLITILKCPDKSLEGLSFEQAAQKRQRDPVEFFMELLEEYDTEIRWISTGANDREKQRLALLKHPDILPGFTDAGAHCQNMGYYDGPLSVLKQAYQTGFLSMGHAIQRITSEPSHWFRLDTGVLSVGKQADFVIINSKALNAPISEQIEIEDPVLDGAKRMVKRGSEDIIRNVYVKGQQVFVNGESTSKLGSTMLGRVLLPHSIATLGMPSIRNRISSEITDHPFSDYWDIFVLKHQHPFNIALHGLGVVLFYGLLIAAWVTKNPWLLLFLPLSQIVGLIGHFFFEKSHVDIRDAIFSVRASRCLNILFVRLIQGKYQEDIAIRKKKLEVYLAGKTAHSDHLSS